MTNNGADTHRINIWKNDIEVMKLTGTPRIGMFRFSPCSCCTKNYGFGANLYFFGFNVVTKRGELVSE